MMALTDQFLNSYWTMSFSNISKVLKLQDKKGVKNAVHSLQGKLYTVHSPISITFDPSSPKQLTLIPLFFHDIFFLDCTSFIFTPATYSFSIVHDNTSVQCTLLYLFYTLSLIKLFRGCFSSLPISERIHHRALISARKTLHSTLYLLLMSFL